MTTPLATRPVGATPMVPMVRGAALVMAAPALATLVVRRAARIMAALATLLTAAALLMLPMVTGAALTMVPMVTAVKMAAPLATLRTVLIMVPMVTGAVLLMVAAP